jgi:N-acetylglucosaminyldiphosphoundecaprenol N-acetyl-beta-D-mannosaminyltransferase
MTIQAARPRAVPLFGVPIDDLTMTETIDAIGELIDRGRREHRTHQVATVNVDFLVNALSDERIRELLQAADLCIADGKPVLWGARAVGMPLRERVAGADLVPQLAERAATTGWRIHLFGSAPGTAEAAAELLSSRYPGAIVTGFSGPIIRDVRHVDEAVLRSILDVDADVLCVALGNPKQEEFIAANRERLRTPVMIGVGGTFDLLIGTTKRAPGWAQKTGFEWVFRAAQEPGRLVKRYARDAIVFFPALLRDVRLARRSRNGSSIVVHQIGDDLIVRAGPADQASSPSTAGRTDGPALSVRVELADVVSLRIDALAELVALLRGARERGASVHLGAMSDTLRAQVACLNLESYFANVAPHG